MLIWHPCFAFPFPLSEVSVSKIKLEKERKRFSAIICCHNETHTKIRRKTRPRRAKQLLIHDCIHTHTVRQSSSTLQHTCSTLFLFLPHHFEDVPLAFALLLEMPAWPGRSVFVADFRHDFAHDFASFHCYRVLFKSSFTPAYQALLIINHYK